MPSNRTFSDFDHGSKTVGTGAGVQLTTANGVKNEGDLRLGMQIIAGSGNAGIVYIGKSDVTAASADATDGFPLVAGASKLEPIDDPSKIYVTADTAAQEVYFEYW